jgi:hypothetical protein
VCRPDRRPTLRSLRTRRTQPHLVTGSRRPAVSGRTSPEPQLPSERRREVRRRPSSKPVWVATILLAGFSIFAFPYYSLPIAQRVRSPWHPWLSPSGYIGQSAGLVALSIFLFLWLYPLRKKWRWLAFTGSMARWLDVHVAAALVLPLMAAVHASWRFDGIIGLGFWSMMVVCLSGVVGRYLYVRIPRSQSGLELGAEELAAERRALLTQLAGRTGLRAEDIERLLGSEPAPCEGLGVGGTLARMVRDDLTRWRAARALRRMCEALPSGRRPSRRTIRAIVRLARREMSLTQQARMLEATHRVFRYWHIAHRPFAVTALVAVTVHVGVVVAMGATWFW